MVTLLHSVNVETLMYTTLVEHAGYQRVVVKCKNELSVLALHEIIEETPPGTSQAIGGWKTGTVSLDANAEPCAGALRRTGQRATLFGSRIDTG